MGKYKSAKKLERQDLRRQLERLVGRSKSGGLEDFGDGASPDPSEPAASSEIPHIGATDSTDDEISVEEHKGRGTFLSDNSQKVDLEGKRALWHSALPKASLELSVDVTPGYNYDYIPHEDTPRKTIAVSTKGPGKKLARAEKKLEEKLSKSFRS